MALLLSWGAWNGSAQFSGLRSAPLNSNAGTDTGGDFAAQLATDDLGNWIAVWSSTENLNATSGTDADIFFTRSTDRGRSWSAPQTLNRNAPTDSSADVAPRIATDRAGRWIVVWQSRENLGGAVGTDGEIFYSVSTDVGVSWLAPAPLNSNAATDTSEDLAPVIETDLRGTWLVAWHAVNAGGGPTDQDILLSRSTDGGVTWSTVAPLHSSASTDEGNDFNTSLATDGQGNWIAAWSSTEDFPGVQDSDTDIVVSRSSDNGATWSAPGFVRSDAVADKLEDFNAQVRTDGRGTWLIVWESGDDLGGTIGTDQDILVVRSTDNGASWSSAAALNATAATDRVLDSFPSLGTDGSGAWVCVWASGEDSVTGRWGKDKDILAAYSLDEGRTWSAPAVLAAHGATDSDEDSMPHIVADHTGRWIVVWQTTGSPGGSLGTDSDLLFVATFNPLLWTRPQLINTDSATDQRADAFLRLGTDGKGTWLAVWVGTTGNVSEMLFSRSTNNGTAWSTPALFQPTATGLGGRDIRIVTDRQGVWVVVWGYNNQIYSVRSNDDGITWSAPSSLSPGDAGDSNFSSWLDTDRAGNWVLVWGTVRASLGGDFDVMSASSTDNGATWSAPSPLKSNAANDNGDDFDPQVATDGQGRWIAVWMSNDSLNNTIGTDDDIFWAYSVNAGRSWSPAAFFNNNAATDAVDDDDYTPQIATDRAGHWIVAWHSESTLGQTIGPDFDILYMRSSDHGVTWSPAAPLNSNAGSDSGDDRYLELARDEAGNWLTSWVSDEPALGGDRGTAGAASEFDIVISRSQDAGATWSAPAPLNPDASVDSTSEVTPNLVPGAGGKWLAAQTVIDVSSGGDPEPAVYVAFQPGLPLPQVISSNPSSSGFRITSAVLNGNSLTITWTGAGPPYVVQGSSPLPISPAGPGSPNPWSSLLTTCAQTATFPAGPSPAFYRVASVPESGPLLDWASDFRFENSGGASAVAETIYVDGFGIDDDVHELVSGALPLVVEKDVVNPSRFPIAAGYTATIEVQGMTFVFIGGSAGYVPGTAAQIAFSCETTNTPALQPGQTGTIGFTLGGPSCPPAIPLAALPCGLYQVTMEVSVPAVGACAGPTATFTISETSFIFVSSTNRLNMQVDLNPDNIRAPDGPPYPNVVTCVQSRVSVWTDPSAPIGGFEAARTHQVTITTFPNPAATYFVRARTPVFGNKGIGTMASLAPAPAQAPAPPSTFAGMQVFSCTVTAPEGYHGRRGCNGSCGAAPLFQDKVDLTITAIATDGCSIVSRTLRGAAIYECDTLKFEFP